MMAHKKTPLDSLIDEAAGILRKLEKLDRNRKLTFPAFLAEAIELAETTIEKVEKFDHDLEQRPGTLHAQQFVSKLVRVFREPRYPRCPRDSGKVLNVYGSLEAFQELTGIGATVAQAIALAILRVHKKFGDDAFGVIENWDTYDKEYTKLRERIAAIHTEMLSACASVDLEYVDTYPAVLPNERARGLCKVSFKRCPSLSPANGDWPQQIIADAVAAAPIKRETISKPKAA